MSSMNSSEQIFQQVCNLLVVQLFSFRLNATSTALSKKGAGGSNPHIYLSKNLRNSNCFYLFLFFICYNLRNTKTLTEFELWHSKGKEPVSA